MHTKARPSRKRQVYSIVIAVTVFITILGIILAAPNALRSRFGAVRKIITFAVENNIPVTSYPDSITALLIKNPETENFVLNYPVLKNMQQDVDLSAYADSDTVPLFLQWDTRWGYYNYGSNVLGITGCGPVCLSMVAVHLLNDLEMDPVWMAKYSMDNGFCVSGSGTAWALMSEGAAGLGLTAEELPLSENVIVKKLQSGSPIICIMGPGDFTSEGHFIVLTGYEDGKLKVNDPNSVIRSEQLWEYDDIKDQIRNLWAYSV